MLLLMLFGSGPSTGQAPPNPDTYYYGAAKLQVASTTQTDPITGNQAALSSSIENLDPAHVTPLSPLS